MFQRARKLWNGLAVVVLNLFVLFALANLGAHLYLAQRASEAPSASIHFYAAADKLAADPALAKSVYPGRTPEEIAALLAAPTFVSHPVLEMMTEPAGTRFYHVGFENMRYTGKVDASNARASMNGSTWVLGGSTAFGHGVADEETIAAALDVVDTSTSAYLNFGVPGAAQRLEIEKLLLLLEKGYRPKRVIFIDGLNDAYAMLRTRFRPEETPADPRDAYAHDFNLARITGPGGVMLGVRALPVARLYRTLRAARVVEELRVAPFAYEDVYDPASLYRRDPILDYETSEDHSFETQLRDRERYADKLIESFTAGSRAIAGLAKGFGFEARVIYQPIGLVAPDNAFVTDLPRYQKSALYLVLEHLSARVKREIAAGNLPLFTDLSEADRACPRCYVDAVHYDARLSKLLAERIYGARGSR